jgi:hypothetical protein
VINDINVIQLYSIVVLNLPCWFVLLLCFVFLFLILFLVPGSLISVAVHVVVFVVL